METPRPHVVPMSTSAARTISNGWTTRVIDSSPFEGAALSCGPARYHGRAQSAVTASRATHGRAGTRACASGGASARAPLGCPEPLPRHVFRRVRGEPEEHAGQLGGRTLPCAILFGVRGLTHACPHRSRIDGVDADARVSFL